MRFHKEANSLKDIKRVRVIAFHLRDSSHIAGRRAGFWIAAKNGNNDQG